MNRTTAGLGWLVIEAAQGNEKKQVILEAQAKEVREQLSERISSRVEEIRNLQRKAFEESKSVTVF